MTFYKIDKNYLPVATIYLKIGLCNMVLQAIYGGIDGMLVASQQQRYSMLLAGALALFNVVVDHFAVYSLYTGSATIAALKAPMVLIAASTSIFMFCAIIMALRKILKRVQGWEKFTFKEMLPVWWGELGSYLIRGIVPLIHGYQLVLIKASVGFLVTYQLALHLSYICCFPLIAAMQVAIRDAGMSASESASAYEPPKWWGAFLYTGVIPMTIMLLLATVAAVPVMKFVYGYVPPLDHVPFLALFFVGCWFGQWGNTFTIPVRAAKKSYLVTKNFFIAEFVVMLAGTQVLIYCNEATPAALGYLTLLYTFAYGLSNLRDAYRLNKKKSLVIAYENSV